MKSFIFQFLQYQWIKFWIKSEWRFLNMKLLLRYITFLWVKNCWFYNFPLRFYFILTSVTSITSWGQSMSLNDLTEVSNFSWKCQLSYEVLFVYFEWKLVPGSLDFLFIQNCLTRSVLLLPLSPLELELLIWSCLISLTWLMRLKSMIYATLSILDWYMFLHLSVSNGVNMCLDITQLVIWCQKYPHSHCLSRPK